MNENIPTAAESVPEELPNEASNATPVPDAQTPEVAVAPESAEPLESAAAAPVGEAPATEAAAAAADTSPAATSAQLKQLFPALFAGQGFKPLKLRVQADIQERAPGAFSKTQLSAFFRRYTGSTGYLIALTKSKHRFDLDGKEAGELAEEHLVAAREELARRKGLQQERIKAEQAQAKAQHEEQREEQKLLQQQRYNRAGLLHDFERTTLTLANFCVLKGTTPEELPGLLEIARKERAEAPPMQQRPQQREFRGEPRRDGERRPGGAGRPERPGSDDRRGPPRGDKPGPAKR